MQALAQGSADSGGSQGGARGDPSFFDASHGGGLQGHSLRDANVVKRFCSIGMSDVCAKMTSVGWRARRRWACCSHGFGMVGWGGCSGGGGLEAGVGMLLARGGGAHEGWQS